MPLALSILKLTYAAGIAHLDGSWLRHAEEPAVLYRPDWRHAVIGQATANLWRNIVAAVRNGVHVVAVATDCLYVVSDLPADETAQVTGLPFGPNIGQFKVEQADIPLDEVKSFFNEPRSMRRFGGYLLQRGREYGKVSAVGESADSA